MASRSSISDTLPWLRSQVNKLRLIRGGRRPSQRLSPLTVEQKLEKELVNVNGSIYDLVSGRFNDLLEFLDGPIFDGSLFRALYFNFNDGVKIISSCDQSSWNRLDRHNPLSRFSGIMHLVVEDSWKHGVGLLRQPENSALRFSPASFERISVVPSTKKNAAMIIPRDIQYVNFADHASLPAFASKLTILVLPIIKVYREEGSPTGMELDASIEFRSDIVLGALFVVWEKNFNQAELDRMRILADLLAERIEI